MWLCMEMLWDGFLQVIQTSQIQTQTRPGLDCLDVEVKTVDRSDKRWMHFIFNYRLLPFSQRQLYGRKANIIYA